MKGFVDKKSNGGKALMVAKELYENKEFFTANMILQGMRGIGGFRSSLDTKRSVVEWGVFEERGAFIKYIPN
jgi:hypothetical protein